LILRTSDGAMKCSSSVTIRIETPFVDPRYSRRPRSDLPEANHTAAQSCGDIFK
jgi:hypothetical protein